MNSKDTKTRQSILITCHESENVNNIDVKKKQKNQMRPIEWELQSQIKGSRAIYKP